MTRAGRALAVVAILVGAGADAQEEYRVDHDRSHIVAVVGTAGVLSVLGHPHAVIATEGSASICYAEDDVSASSVNFTVPTRSLRIDTPRARRIANMEPLGDVSYRGELQEKMLSERFLWAERYPEMSFRSTRVRRSDPRTLWLEGRFSMRGRTQPVAFPVEISANGEALRLSGEVTVKQTDFGMEPESIAGVVRVANAVDVRFLILARGIGDDC